MKTKKNMMIVIVIAIISSFAGMTANAQSLESLASAMSVSATDTNAIRRAWSDFANKIGPTTFDYEVNNGHLSAWRHEGWYIGLNGGANFRNLNNKLTINPNAAVLSGYQWQHWHAEARIGATQFDYIGSKKIGLQTDLGLYYDFMPMLGHKWNIYAGVFGGYQFVKVKGVYEDCTSIIENPFESNSVRYGAEIGTNLRLHHKTNSIGIYARGFGFSYKSLGVKTNAFAGEVGIRFTFGLGRKVKYN